MAHSQATPSLATTTGQRDGKALKGLLMATLLAAGMGSAQAASQSVGAVGAGATDNRANGSFDLLTNNFQTGRETVLNQAYAFALEFDLSSLPAGAVINAASLSLRTARNDKAGQTALFGYVGNGSITLADMTAGSQLLLFTPAGTGPESHDVTSFVQGTYSGAVTWIGFNLKQSPLGASYASWDGPGYALEPSLAITYTVPAAVPEPSAALLMALGLGGLLAHGRRRRAPGQQGH